MTELFLKGHRACAGCGSVLALRYVLEALGKDVIVVNATGCMEIISSQYPESNWGVPYVHCLFENTASVATGVSRALKHLDKEGTVVVIGGDGASYDIGFGAVSGAMERNEDILYVCYDNEAYANTGLQRSGATPFGSATTTTPSEMGGKGEWKKNLTFIAAAHAVPYAAAASVAFLPDLQAKLKKAKQKKGFRLVNVHAPCTVGWKINPAKAVEVARKAVECGLWNLFEIDDGKFKLSRPVGEAPVAEYLKMQGRFKHLTPKQVETIEEHARSVKPELEKLEKANVNFQRFL